MATGSGKNPEPKTIENSVFIREIPIQQVFTKEKKIDKSTKNL